MIRLKRSAGFPDPSRSTSTSMPGSRPVRPLALPDCVEGQDLGARPETGLQRDGRGFCAGPAHADDDRLRAAVGEEVLDRVAQRPRLVERRSEGASVVGEAEDSHRRVVRSAVRGPDERRHGCAHADDRVDTGRSLLDVDAWVRRLSWHFSSRRTHAGIARSVPFVVSGRGVTPLRLAPSPGRHARVCSRVAVRRERRRRARSSAATARDRDPRSSGR